MAQRHTVLNAMILCGVNNSIQFNGATAAQRIVTEIFDDDFNSYMDKTIDDLNTDLKSYSSLTVANGQIRLTPGITKRIKAFIQWSRDMIRVGDDPATVVYPVDNATTLMKRYMDHERFRAKANNLSEAAKPRINSTKRNDTGKYTYNESEPGTTANNESDSNADTCCLGSNFVPIEFTGRTADVFPYDKSYKPLLNVPIVNAVTAWKDPRSGETFILVINEELYYGTILEHSLINPNQIRHYGIGYWDNPYDEQRPLGIEVYDDLVIPMEFEGTKLQFNSYAPTDDE